MYCVFIYALRVTLTTNVFQVIGRVNEKYDPCTEKHSVKYFNHAEVQKALHVNKEFAPAKWDTCRYTSFSATHVYSGLVPWIESSLMHTSDKSQ